MLSNINPMCLCCFIVRENDVLYGGRGRRHFHRVANQRFLELVKMSRKEYNESRCKKAVAKRIVNEWKGQTPPGRFLQQDPKTEKWYEIKEAKIMEKTCQALRDLKRERGPAGAKQGISERMVDPWETPVSYQQIPAHMQPHVNGQMHGGHQIRTHGHHPFQPGPPWMGQGVYPPAPMVPPGTLLTQMPPPYMARPAPAMPSTSSSLVMEKGKSDGNTTMKRDGPMQEVEKHEWTNNLSPTKGERVKIEDDKMATDPVFDNANIKKEEGEMGMPEEEKNGTKNISGNQYPPKSVEEVATDTDVETLPASDETQAADKVPAPTPLVEMTPQLGLTTSVAAFEVTADTKDEVVGALDLSSDPMQETTLEQIPEMASNAVIEKAVDPGAVSMETPNEPAPETNAAQNSEEPTGGIKLEPKAKAEPVQCPTNDNSTDIKAEAITKDDLSNKEESKAGNKKDSAKDGNDHKKGELEAAALLANMFR